MAKAEQAKTVGMAGLSSAFGFAGGLASNHLSGTGQMLMLAGLLTVFGLFLFLGRRHELNEYLPCQAGCKCEVPKRNFWRLPPGKKFSGTAVCPDCFFRITVREPNETTGDIRAFT